MKKILLFAAVIITICSCSNSNSELNDRFNELDKKIIEIDGSDLTESILKLPKNNYIELEKLLLNTKLPICAFQMLE